MSTLRSRQQIEGGFVLWGGHHEVNDFVTVYAVHVMIEARDRGFVVPDDMLKNATIFLRQIASAMDAILRTNAIAPMRFTC